MIKDTASSLFRSANRFLTGTILSRVSGLARDVSLAAAFGTEASISAFLVAFRLAHLFRRLLGEGSLQTAFTPQFEKLRHECTEKASHFFKSLYILLTATLCGLIVIIMSSLALAIYFFEFNSDTLEIIKLTFLMTPSLLFICLFGLNAALLQCEKFYFLTGFSPVAFNLVWNIGIVYLASLTPTEAMPWLAGWVILACAAQWAITLPTTFSVVKQHSKHAWRVTSALWTPEIKNLIKALSMALIGLSASQINNALDSIFARYADLEGPAYLWYAIRMQQLPLALFGVALSGALLPPLSRAMKSGDLSAFKHFMNAALTRTLLFMLPITAAIYFGGDISVELLFGRGQFGSESIMGTTASLWGYGVGLVPMALVLILSPAFYARENYKTPVYASVASMILNVVLNTFMIVILGWGAAGVALATSLSAWLNALWLGWGLRKEIGQYTSQNFGIKTAKIALAAAAGFAGVAVLDMVSWGQFRPWQIVSASHYDLHEGNLATLLHLLSQCLLFMAIFGPIVRKDIER